MIAVPVLLISHTLLLPGFGACINWMHIIMWMTWKEHGIGSLEFVAGICDTSMVYGKFTVSDGHRRSRLCTRCQHNPKIKWKKEEL